jgi:hypothetical protein
MFTGEFIALKDGRTLPIKFRIEEGDPEPPPILPFQCTNGSFEVGSLPQVLPYAIYATTQGLPDWEVTLTSVQWFNPQLYVLGALGPAPDGNNIVDLNGDFPLSTHIGGGIKQEVSTVIGQLYSLTFEAGTSKLGGRDGTGTVEVLINDVLVATVQLTAEGVPIEWQEYEVIHQANGTTTSIELRIRDVPGTFGNPFVFIDRVCVSPA